MKKIILGTRASALACAQTEIILAQLQQAYPHIHFEVRKIKTTGDRMEGVTTTGLPLGKGVFTLEFEQALLRREIQMAVHSLKDLPTDSPSELKLGATPKRADARDILITRGETRIEDLPQKGIFATGSPRRFSQIQAVRPDLTFVDLRGNIDTRLRKFKESKWCGILLAKSGLDRLKPETYGATITPISYEQMLPAPGQGALAIQVRADDAETLSLLSPLHDAETYAEVTAERHFLKCLGGGCQAPIAAYAHHHEKQLFLEGFYKKENDPHFYKGSLSGSVSEPEILGKKLAEQLLKQS